MIFLSNENSANYEVVQPMPSILRNPHQVQLRCDFVGFGKNGFDVIQKAINYYLSISSFS
jgi:hypothetical protein